MTNDLAGILAITPEWLRTHHLVDGLTNLLNGMETARIPVIGYGFNDGFTGEDGVSIVCCLSNPEESVRVKIDRLGRYSILPESPLNKKEGIPLQVLVEALSQRRSHAAD